MPVKKPDEKITYFLMNFIARKEVKAFTIVPSNLVKIVLNHNGEACGYYAVNNTDGLGLIQIYVRQEFRR